MAVTPEQQQANQAVGQAYGDAPATAANQKAALMQAVAQAGNAGAQAVKAQQGAIAGQRTAALGQVAQGAGVPSVGDFATQLQQTASQPFDAAAWATGATNPQGFGETVGRLGGDYMQALQAAIPMNQEWTQRQVNTLASRAASEREQRTMDLERSKLSLAAAREDRERARSENQLYPVKLSDGRTVMVSGASALSDDRTRQEQSVSEQRYAEELARTSRRQQLGKLIGEGPSTSALDLVLAEAGSIEEARGGIDMLAQAGMLPTTAGGKPLSSAALKAYLEMIFGLRPVAKR